MEEILEMSMTEIDRYAVLVQVQKKKLTQVQASQILGITDRQVRNLLSKVKLKGAEGVISKKRGRLRNNRKPKCFKAGDGEIFHSRKKAWKDYDLKQIGGMNMGANGHQRDHLKSELNGVNLSINKTSDRHDDFSAFLLLLSMVST